MAIPATELSKATRAVRTALEAGSTPLARLQAALVALAGAFGAVTATLHRAEPATGTLRLLASLGIPEKLLSVTQAIPFGKGMAGICAARRKPVTVCNLQTDSSGVARPAAKETGVAGAIVVPILAPEDGRLIGTLGIGKPAEHTYTEVELKILTACALVFAEEVTVTPGR